jgi:hypothetical protein
MREAKKVTDVIDFPNIFSESSWQNLAVEFSDFGLVKLIAWDIRQQTFFLLFHARSVPCEPFFPLKV